tara:strand:+ start:61 stop:327 length:267 start_codon:yes stop_codon:yes gene_type:complete
MSKNLITFEIRDGENEYRDYGIFDEKNTEENIIKHFYGLENLEEENGWYWRDTSVVRISSSNCIDNDKIKTMREYGIAYEHNIEEKAC